MLDHLDRLPVPQRDALRTAFGLSAGPAPDRFLVGLAVLSLLSEVAEEQPLVCLVDDEQWLDRASAQVLAFVARRLAAESVGLVFAARDARRRAGGAAGAGGRRACGRPMRAALLDSVLTGPLDERVRDRIVAETRGNPLALLELPRGLTPAELAGGFGLPGAAPLSGRIEESFRRRVERSSGRHPAAAAGRGGRSDRRPGAWCGGRPGGSGSAPRRRRRRPRRAWSSSAPGCGSVTRWCARRPTGRRRFRTGSDVHGALAEATDPQARSRPPGLAPGAGRGRARRGRRRGARALGRPGAGARRPGRGGRVPRARGDADARTRPPGAARCSRRPGRSATPARSTRHWGCWSRSRPARLTRCRRAEVEHLRGQIAFDAAPRQRRRPAAAQRGQAPRAARRRPGARDAPGGARGRDVGRRPGHAPAACGRPPRPRAPRRPAPTRRARSTSCSTRSRCG